MEITERHVQAIWYDLNLRPAELVTRRGSSVRVVSPGEWNLGAGPDFRHAVLEIGRERRRVEGDVEMHLTPADWDRHRHGDDPAYREVVAHVTWGCGPDPVTLPPSTVSIWLGRQVTANPAFDPAAIDLESYPFARLPLGERPCETLIGHSPDRVREELLAAGRSRILRKAERMKGLMSRHPRRQAYYREVMGAFGYSQNADGFRRVAERVPFAELPRECGAARTAFRTAGTFEEWNRIALRPSNEPEMRLERAADILLGTPMMAYAESTDFSEASCRRMVDAMCGPPQAAQNGFGLRLMGRGRAAAILANVVVPFALAEGRLCEVPDWLPPEDISSPVRLMASRLLGRDHNPAAFYARSDVLIQGLLEIYRMRCAPLHPDCDSCSLANIGQL